MQVAVIPTYIKQINVTGVSALCDAVFWRLSGEYGVLRAAKFKQNEIFIVRMKEL
jgi:hypothetical protein